VNHTFLALLGCTFGISSADAALSLLYRDEIDRVSELIMVHEYPEAEVLLDSLERRYPRNTDIRFQEMILYFTWIDDYGIADSLGDRFMAAVDATILFGDRDTDSDPDDKWAWFFKGSAYAYRSLYRSYVEGISLGTIRGLIADANTGVNNLRRAAWIDTSFADPLIGIGKYLHWKAQKFPWPLSSSEDADRGVRMLQEAIRRGVVADGGAVQTLGWIYMAEHRYDDAIALVRPWMEKYPHSRFFKEIIARAHQEKGDYGQAETLFYEILNGLSPRERASNFVVMKYQRWVARLRCQQGDRVAACRMAQRLRLLDYRGVHRDWLNRKLAEVDKIIREACVP